MSEADIDRFCTTFTTNFVDKMIPVRYLANIHDAVSKMLTEIQQYLSTKDNGKLIAKIKKILIYLQHNLTQIGNTVGRKLALGIEQNLHFDTSC